MMSPEAKAARREYMREHTREYMREYMRSWRKENPDRAKAIEERYWEKKAMQLNSATVANAKG